MHEKNGSLDNSLVRIEQLLITLIAKVSELLTIDQIADIRKDIAEIRKDNEVIASKIADLSSELGSTKAAFMEKPSENQYNCI